MRSFIKIILLLLLPAIVMAQQYPFYVEPAKNQVDSLRLISKNTSNDTLRMTIFRDLGRYYLEIERDSTLYYSEQRLLIAKRLKLKLWEADAFEVIGYVLIQLGNYPKSLQALLQALKIAEDEESEKNIYLPSKFTKDGNPRVARLTSLASIHTGLGQLYEATGNLEKQLANYFEARNIGEKINDKSILSVVNRRLGSTYIKLNKLDSALSFEQKGLDYSNSSGFRRYRGLILLDIGSIYFKKENYDSAKKYFAASIQTSQEQSNFRSLAAAYISMANLFMSKGEKDSSLFYAQKGLENYENLGSTSGILSAYTSLSSIYKLKNNIDSAYLYLGLAMVAKDSVNNAEKIKQFQNIGFDEQLRQKQMEEEKAAFQNRIRAYAMLTGLGVFLLIALILYRNNRQKQKTNVVLEKTLSNLTATQTQLIQSEKMASLGELTAGIAHEIQNPLNFVNNFSEVNTELIEEAGQEIDNGNINEVKTILNDIKENEQKINHHGKRADAIVKGMLQHSQTSTGQKELTDINKLADEYLRLSYRGLRAKDKLFNVTLQTVFDQNIGKINIIPQDIGRVLLNLFNNAFYAVNEKTKTTDVSYLPTITVQTKKLNDKIEIIVADNGNGIPQNIVDKIFQPFFTTKPTGQGTGLGLSLTYDIIKAHGGEINVETKEGEGSEFIILFPHTKEAWNDKQ